MVPSMPLVSSKPRMQIPMLVAESSSIYASSQVLASLPSARLYLIEPLNLSHTSVKLPKQSIDPSTYLRMSPSAKMSPSTTSRPFYGPTIDLSTYLKDPSSAEAERVIESVREACLSTGFFQLVNHGLEKSLQKEVFDAAEKFFKLPFEEKKMLDAKTHMGHRGYDVLASQSYEEGVLPDLKEVRSFCFCFAHFLQYSAPSYHS